jgi:2-polyprenyl-3-methyl-5-hydroxy-6-metoxy-1,4-benzoquinol methylase
MATLTAEQVEQLDPYAFLAVLGKRAIHPGGRASTDRQLEPAAVRPGERVLDIGCGVGTTAIRLATEYGVEVVAADILMPRMSRSIPYLGYVPVCARKPPATNASADQEGA